MRLIIADQVAAPRRRTLQLDTVVGPALQA
jgi:hypothetical protein